MSWDKNSEQQARSIANAKSELLQTYGRNGDQSLFVWYFHGCSMLEVPTNPLPDSQRAIEAVRNAIEGKNKEILARKLVSALEEVLRVARIAPLGSPELRKHAVALLDSDLNGSRLIIDYMSDKDGVQKTELSMLAGMMGLWYSYGFSMHEVPINPLPDTQRAIEDARNWNDNARGHQLHGTFAKQVEKVKLILASIQAEPSFESKDVSKAEATDESKVATDAIVKTTGVAQAGSDSPPEAVATDEARNCLSGKSLKIFNSLIQRLQWVSYETLRREVWKNSDILDSSMQDGIKRLSARLAKHELPFTIENRFAERRAKIERHSPTTAQN